MKKTLLVFLAVIVLIQFFRIDKTTPVSEPDNDMFMVENVTSDMQSLLKTSCFDCHSNTVTYPWYTNVAPVSWWIKHHINEGREELNFNEWGSYSTKKKLHKLEEIEEMVYENEMPLKSYLWMHSEAKLTKQEQKKHIIWAKKLRTGEQIEVP